MRLANCTTKSLIFVAVLLACSCGKDGDPGPPGATGPQGPQGPPGPVGTANVIYSEWLEIDWNLVDTRTLKHMEIEVPALTEDVWNRGVTLMYWKAPSNAVFPLPYTTTSFGETVMRSFVAWQPHTLWYTLEKEGGNLTDYETSGLVRYIILPGGVPANGRLAPVDYKDYEAVKAYFGLPD